MNIEIKRVHKWQLLLLVLFISYGCKNIVDRYDERMAKRYEKKGFVQDTMNSSRFNVNYWDNNKKNAPVIVFVHGFGGDGKISWWGQVKKLNEDYRIVVPDILWFGNSSSTEQPTLSAQIEAVNELMTHLELKKVHLAGISYGGFISLGVAHRYPENLQTLTLVDSPGPTVSKRDIEAFCNRIGVDSIQEAFVPTTGQEVKRLMEFSFEDPPLLTNGIREQTIGRYFSKYPTQQSALLRELAANRNELSGTVPVKTLVLWGKEDQVFSTEQAKALADLLNADLKIIEGAGHALPGEKSSAFNQSLEAFIRKAGS